MSEHHGSTSEGIWIGLCVLLLVIVQLWLLTATVNAYLGGDTFVVVPAALASLVCLGLNAGLLWYLYALER